MSVEFFDRQNPLHPANGARIQSGDDLSRLLAGFLNRKPFFCELLTDNGYKQLIGIGGTIGCVQHSRIDGSPPYLMAVANNNLDTESETEFLIDDRATPVLMRYCIPFEIVKQAAICFLETGKCDPSVSWEEI